MTEKRTFSIETSYKKHKDLTGSITVGNEILRDSLFPEYLPSWNENEKYKPLEFFQHFDKGKLADFKFPSFSHPKTQIDHISPKFGSEVTGIQISELSQSGKNELALLTAQRGVLIFRNQDFFDKGPKYVCDFAKYYGPLHIHQTSGAPKGFPELHVVYYRQNNQDKWQNIFKQANRTSMVHWHSDVTYELQPPGITFFGVLELPNNGNDGGGDTIFADMVEAYNRLSPEFQKRLEGLKAIHSSHEQAQKSQATIGIVKRDPVNNIHPIIRIHPVTGEKALFVNPNFTRRIVGFKQEESDSLLDFLYEHINKGHDFQLKANYEKGTVVVWDNRRVIHSALFDWYHGLSGRHAVRVTPQAERPVSSLKDLNRPNVNNEPSLKYHTTYF